MKVAMPSPARATAWAAFLVTVQACALVTAATVDCGTASLRDFCTIVGRDFTASQATCSASAVRTMREIQDDAKAIGLILTGVAADLAALERLPGPKIVHLSDPAHFLVLVRSGPESVQLVDNGQVAVVPRNEFEQRYTGHALVGAGPAEGPEPRISLSEFYYAFGVAGVGQRIEHTFRIANTGTAELVITPQATGCCGAPTIATPKDRLEPGESVEATVRYAVTSSGPLMVSAKVLSNDPNEPLAFFTIHGKAPHDLRAYADFMRFAAPKEAAWTRCVTVAGPAEMDITEVDTEHGLLLTQLGEPVVDEDQKKTWTLTVSLKDESFVGEIVDTIRIKTTHAERPLITIPVTGVIRGDLRIGPPSVFFGFIKPGAEAKQEVVIQSRSGAEFAIAGAECKAAGVTVGAPQQRQDGAWVIQVSVDTAKAGVVDAAITVTTDVPGEETLTIPVYAHVTEGE